MATATRTARTIVASVNSATQESGSFNIGTALGLKLTLRVVNGATPPATGCLVTVNTSNDGTNWRKETEWRAGVWASTTYDWPVELPQETMHVQVVFGSTSQNVTKEALGQELTSAG